MQARPWRAVGLVAAGLVAVGLSIAGCSSNGVGPKQATTAAASTEPARPAAAAQTLTAARPCLGAEPPRRVEHVVWIVMENHGRDQVVGSPDAPYFNQVLGRCGYAANAHAVAHPSLPNYLAMTSGSTHGIRRTELPTTLRIAGPSLFSQLGPGGWRTLAQSMPANCFLDNSGTYVPRHNPATYFDRIVDQCATQAVPLGATPDLSAPFTLVVPDQRSNTHDTDVAYGDAWMATFLPRVLTSAEYQAGRTVVFLTYDEDEDGGDPSNPIATVVIAPSTKGGTRSATYFTHYSLLRTTQELLGLEPLGKAKAATSMSGSFNLAE